MTKPTVDFTVPCHEGDRAALYSNLDAIVCSHEYEFNTVYVVHQRCKIDWFDVKTMQHNIVSVTIPQCNYNDILEKFNIPTEDPRADEITHGPTSTHYWKNHCVNQLAGLSCSDADYIVFSDSDCIMIKNNNWIDKAIEQLEKQDKILIVCPSEGCPGINQMMSQQLFICNRKRLSEIDFNCWDGKFIDGGAFQEFYVLLEGRISMYMLKENLYRMVLPDEVGRYYHDWTHHKDPKELYDLAMEKLK